MSIDALNYFPSCTEENACGRWAAGAVGLIITISALVFIILGSLQPEWFTRAVGTIGSPHSWPLWTIAAGAFMIGGTLVTCAITNFCGACEAKIKDPEDMYPPEARGWYELRSTEPSHIKQSFHSKITLDALFENDKELLAQIPDHPNELPSEKDMLRSGIQTQFEQQSTSALKGYFTGERKERYLAFELECMSSHEEIASCFSKRCEEEDLDYNEEQQARFAKSCKESSALLVVARTTYNNLGKSRWVQWDISRYILQIRPSFLDDFTGYRFAPKEKLPEWPEQNAAAVQLEEQGFAALKGILRGETRSDHYGLQWRLKPKDREEQ